MALTDKLTNIADAIRSKTGNTDSLTLDAMPSAIKNIESGVISDDFANSIIDRSINTLTPEDLAGVTKIGDNAFANCALKTVTIGPNISSIGKGAFYDCTWLTSVILPEGLTTIDFESFSGCIKLKTISIPSSVTLIQYMAFNGCTALTDIYYAGTAEQWAAISKGGSNPALTNATIHYNSIGGNT